MSELGGKAPAIKGLPTSQDYWSPAIKALWPGRASSRRAKPMRTPGSTGVEGAGGTGGPGCGARGRWRGLAGLRVDAPSRRLAARTARGRAAAHGRTEQPGPRAHRAARPTGAPSSPAHGRTREAIASRSEQKAWLWHTHSPIISPYCPASSVARWTPPRSASWAAWVRHEKPSARYTASGCADRDGSSECEATATDRS